MKLLITRPRFRRLWASQLISLMGDWLSLVAISLLALSDDGGVIALALVLAAHTLPTAVMAPVVGALCDRFDRIRLIIASNVIQLGLTLGMVLAVIAGSLLAVQVLLVLRTAAAAVIMPAENAALPHLVEPDELVRANAITAATWSLAFALGMALGGLLALLGPELALLIDASTFAVAALLVRPLPRIVAERDDHGGLGHALRTAGRDMRAAARHALADRELRGAVLAKTPIAFAGGGAWVLLNVRAADPAFIAAGSVALGLLHALRGVGTGVGPMLVASRLEEGRRDGAARTLAAGVMFAAVAVFAAVAWWPISLAAAFLWGCGAGMNWVVSTAGIQRVAPDALLGRTTAIDLLLATTAMATGALAGAFAIEATGSAAAAGWVGLGLGVGSWLVVNTTSGAPRPTLRARAARAR